MIGIVYVHNINITEKMTATNLSLQPVARFYSLHQNKIILAIVVLLSLYLLAFAAEITWRLIPQADATQANQVINNNSFSSQAASRLDISPLTKLNLFGDPEEKAARHPRIFVKNIYAIYHLC